MSKAESALHGYNSSVTSAWNSLQQFGTNKGNSASTTTGADTTESSQDSMARSKMMNAVDSYAKANHISRDEAFGQLMDKSVRGDVSGEAYVGARGGVGFELFGNGGKAEFGGRMSARGTASSGSRTILLSQDANLMLTIMIPAVRQLKTSESLLITSSTRNQASLETSLITMHLLGLINFLPLWPVRK